MSIKRQKNLFSTGSYTNVFKGGDSTMRLYL
jgi:hypothetical protein